MTRKVCLGVVKSRACQPVQCGRVWVVLGSAQKKPVRIKQGRLTAFRNAVVVSFGVV